MKTPERLPRVLLSHAFRPFFLLAAIWAAVAICVWLWLLGSGAGLPSRFDPLTWHIHEMLFGFVMAAIAGFLLTAVANWTGRPPVRGILLGILVGAWIAGRIVCWFSRDLPPALVVSVDLALQAVLAMVVLREILGTRSWRNLPMVAPVIVLTAANFLMHMESFGQHLPPGLGWRLALTAIIALISAVGGRIVPAFTRNWLKKYDRGDVPEHGLIDRLSLALLHAGLLAWAVFPDKQNTGFLLVSAALLNLWRLARWRGLAVREEFLLSILHIGYCWLVIGVGLLGASCLSPSVTLTAAIHTLTVGAMGTMILAVMTRATRGHTGRPLAADRSTVTIYLLVLTAACTRLLAAFNYWYAPMLKLSGTLWIIAYGLFAIIYGPMLVRPRLQPV